MRELEWHFNNHTVRFSQLKSGDFPAATTDFQKSACEFGKEWLNNKELFSIPTSGSTGVPKQIFIKRTQMEASAHLTEKALHLEKGSTELLCLDTQHIAGKMMLVRSFVTGMNMMAVEPSANPFQYLPDDAQIDFVALVPYQLTNILESPMARRRLNAVKTVIVGGAPLNEALKADIALLNCQVYATYGMTETISHIALQRLNGPDRQDHFSVLPGVTIQHDARGCMVIFADYLSSAPIVTNDLVEILTPTEFRWLGRFDNMINTGGIKVFPEKIEREVENVFLQLGIKRRFFISGMTDQSLGTKVVLVVEGIAPDEAQTKSIYKMLGDRLTRFELPKEIRVVPEFTETASQKIDRIATAAKLRPE